MAAAAGRVVVVRYFAAGSVVVETKLYVIVYNVYRLKNKKNAYCGA